MSNRSIIWGIQGRLEIEEWHTKDGDTLFWLYDTNDESFYFRFSTGVEKFVKILQQRSGRLSQGRAMIVVEAKSDDVICLKCYDKAFPRESKTIVFLTQNQVNDIIAKIPIQGQPPIPRGISIG